MTILRNFWNEDQGQDLIEYTLLLGFVALASAALFIGAGEQRFRHLDRGQHPACRGEHQRELAVKRRYAEQSGSCSAQSHRGATEGDCYSLSFAGVPVGTPNVIDDSPVYLW